MAKTTEINSLKLNHGDHELTRCKVYNHRIQFALMGLMDMYSFGGAIEAIEVSSSLAITIKGREASHFGVYYNLKPRFCSVNSIEDGFLIHLKIAY
ncbi:hypothetical protein RJ639_036939 [Escallonia herrerae]|uniref:Uncharacterized protein n=1 Tax=Escallonia herrerae TaxID=1293975 RepID=A0AA89BC77_9ASTE|nr:hypothetical protein RJ639_036939 [Escallonia herrerae]